MKKFVSTNPIIVFVLLAYLISWSFWCLPIIMEIPKDVFIGIILLGNLGPALAAFIFLHYQSGSRIRIQSKSLFWLFFSILLILFILIRLLVELGYIGNWVFNNVYNGIVDIGVLGTLLLLVYCFIWGLFMSNARKKKLKENYLESFLFNKKKWKWYVLALLFYPVLYALSYGLGKIFNYETSETLIDLNWGFFIGFLLSFFLTGGQEEFGWRGYLQKEMQKKYNPLIASLVIAAVWMLWHLPLHFNGFYPPDFTFLSRIALSLQLAFLFTWFYNRSGYSILAVMILHAMNNNVDKMFGGSYLPAMVLAVGIIIYFIIDNKMWKKKAYHKKIYG